MSKWFVMMAIPVPTKDDAEQNTRNRTVVPADQRATWKEPVSAWARAFSARNLRASREPKLYSKSTLRHLVGFRIT